MIMDRKGWGRVAAAAGLSVLFPGAGQAFNREAGKGVGFGLLYITAPLVLLYLALVGVEWAQSKGAFARCIVILISAVESGQRAYEIHAGEESGPADGWKAGLAFILLGWAANGGIDRLAKPITRRLLQANVARWEQDDKMYQARIDELQSKLYGPRWVNIGISTAPVHPRE
jgi:hypothetical protein